MPRKIYGEKQIFGADSRQITEAPKEMGKYFSLCEEKLFLGRREIYYHLECKRQVLSKKDWRRKAEHA